MEKIIELIENLEKENFSDNDFLIKTSDILTSLQPYEVQDYIIEEYNEDIDEYEENYLESKEEYFNYLVDNGYININNSKCDNTYNWSAKITQDINYYIYENELYNNVLVELSVHLYGDIRCNYTDTILLQFDSIEQFLDVLMENNLYKTIEVNNVNYSLYTSFFSEGIEVENESNNEYFDIYSYELEDIINDIKEYEK